MSTVDKWVMAIISASVIGLIISRPNSAATIANSIFGGVTDIAKAIQLR